MSHLQSNSAKPIQLKWDGGEVVVTPEDQDRFVVEAGKAVASCQGMQAFDRFVKQFNHEFLPRLHGWCETHKDKIAQCFVLFPVGDIRVFMIGASPRFDFELSDTISDLENEFDGLGWKADIVQLPSASPEMICSFFNPSESIQVYGHGD